MITISLAPNETWRDALARLLPSASRRLDDAMGPVTDDERAACLALFDALVGGGTDAAEAATQATYRSCIPAAVNV